MRTIFAEYNPHRNSIDVYTSAGYMLRIDCWEAERNLKTTPGSDCALNALAIDEPLEYAKLYLDGTMQLWVDAEGYRPYFYLCTYFRLINPSPARHTITPTILFHVIASLYPTYPTMMRITPSMDEVTIWAALTFQPALYAYIKPTSSPTSTMPSTKNVQFAFFSSVKMSRLSPRIKNIINATAAPTR